MRIVCISDTHSLHKIMDETNPLPKGDILIHAGDCTNVGKQHEVEDFIYWFQNIKGFDTKIFIAGNHDFAFEHKNQVRHKTEYDWIHNLINEENLSQSDCVYLEDSHFTIESPEFNRPIKFYGSPWQPEFYNWAFNLPRNGWELETKWNDIPNDTDVLITHGPPYGVLDFVRNNRKRGLEFVGCEQLMFRVEHLKPLLHVFGHIHDAYGVSKGKDTLYVNASTCNDRYVPLHAPIVIDLKLIDNVITPIHIENEYSY